MGLLTPDGQTAPDDMNDDGIWPGINPDWMNGPVLTDDQIAAALASPYAAAFGNALTQPIPQMPGSVDGGPTTPIPTLGPGGNYLNVVYQLGTEQTAGGLVSLASLFSGAPQIPASAPQAVAPPSAAADNMGTTPPQSGDDTNTPADPEDVPASESGDGSDAEDAPPVAAPQVAAAQTSRPPDPVPTQAADSDTSGGSAGDLQPVQVKLKPITLDQMLPELQAQTQGISMPQLPNSGPSANSIDSYLRAKNSPLAGQGANFLKHAQKYDIDPRLMVAIAGAETGFGKNITAGQNNAFNLLYNHSDPHNSPFDNWDHAIKTLGKSLANPSNGYHLSDTMSMYKGVHPGNGYCRSGSTCDAGLANLNQFLREQGGDPNALHYPGQ